MTRMFLVIVSVCSIFLIPSIFSWIRKYEIKDMMIIVNSLLPIIILIVLSIALYKIISVLEEIREQEKIWLEGINYNLLEIKKYLKGGKTEEVLEK